MNSSSTIPQPFASLARRPEGLVPRWQGSLLSLPQRPSSFFFTPLPSFFATDVCPMSDISIRVRLIATVRNVASTQAR